jgi:uncharacterized protein DUF6226
VDERTLRDAVEDAFAVTSRDTPPWPNPHAGMRMPSDEEYSRCLDPGKYRIIKARCEAWKRALTRLGLAEALDDRDLAKAWPGGLGPQADSATLLRPIRSGAIPMLLRFQSFLGVPEAAVNIGAGEPPVLLLSAPDCGCDACDSGSAMLLEDLDNHLLAVVGGDFVHVTTRKGTVMTTGIGWSASGLTSQEAKSLLAKARTGRSRHRVVQGARWW